MSEESGKELEQCKKEREEYLNGWKRAKADLINYQKEEAKRFEEFLKFTNAELVKELITVLDSFALAEQYQEVEPPAGGSTSQKLGLALIKAQLEEILKKNGLEQMAVTIGQKFDPASHESIGEVESDQPAGTIIEETETGYILNGRVIRPARVRLAKPKSEA